MTRSLILGLKVLVGLMALYLLFTWSRWLFQPDVMLERLNVSHTSLFGLNMLKSDMGGFVLAIGVLTLMAIWKGGTWYSAALIATAAILGTRILSGIQDGFDAAVNFAVGLESAVFVLILILFWHDRTATKFT